MRSILSSKVQSRVGPCSASRRSLAGGPLILLSLLATPATGCAQSAGIGPTQIVATYDQAELEIVLAVLRQQVQSGGKACLANPLQPPLDTYRANLTRPGASPTLEQQKYQIETRAIAGGRGSVKSDSRTLSLANLRGAFPRAKTVAGAECPALIRIHRPIVEGNRAFLLLGRSNRCVNVNYRVALGQVGARWSVLHMDPYSQTAGAPGCAARRWRAPSPLKIERILIG